MRLAGGAWCIAALILTNFYSSVLTSLIAVSTAVPLVNSVEEAASNEDIKLVIQKGFGSVGIIAVSLQPVILPVQFTYYYCNQYR